MSSNYAHNYITIDGRIAWLPPRLFQSSQFNYFQSQVIVDYWRPWQVEGFKLQQSSNESALEIFKQPEEDLMVHQQDKLKLHHFPLISSQTTHQTRLNCWETFQFISCWAENSALKFISGVFPAPRTESWYSSIDLPSRTWSCRKKKILLSSCSSIWNVKAFFRFGSLFASTQSFLFQSAPSSSPSALITFENKNIPGPGAQNRYLHVNDCKLKQNTKKIKLCSGFKVTFRQFLG